MNCSRTLTTFAYTCDVGMAIRYAHTHTHTHIFNALRGNFRKTDCEIYFYVHNVCSTYGVAYTRALSQTHTQTHPQSSGTIHTSWLTDWLLALAIRICNSLAVFSRLSVLFFALLSLHAMFLYGMLKIRFVHNDSGADGKRRELANEWTQDDCLILNSCKCIALPWIFMRKISTSVGCLLLW